MILCCSAGIKSIDNPAPILKHIRDYCPLYEIECGNSKYRTIDGTCNNIRHPNWGAYGTSMQRISEPFYADGMHVLCSK